MPRVRAMEPRDAVPVARLLRAAFAEHRARYTPAAFAATLPGPAALARRLAEGPASVAEADAIVGTLGARLRADGLHLRSMAVHPAHRGRGWGALLLREAEVFAVRAGAPRLVLSTTPFLRAAIALYEAHGFAPTPGGPGDLHGTPLLTMAKPLEAPACGA